MNNDDDFIPNGTAVVPAHTEQSLVALGTLQANTPTALITGATAIADQLADVIRKKQLSNRIGGKEYVRVEGWTTLGALLGVIPREDDVKELDDGGYLATVSLVRISDGAVVSRASAECGMDEDTWAGRPRYARRSMAVTRATGKAARLAFSWIMALAGFEATPAEEMPYHGSSADEGHGEQPSRNRQATQNYQTSERFASPKQIKLIEVKLNQAGIPFDEFLEKFKIEEIEKLPFSTVNAALHWIAGSAA